MAPGSKCTPALDCGPRKAVKRLKVRRGVRVPSMGRCALHAAGTPSQHGLRCANVGSAGQE